MWMKNLPPIGLEKFRKYLYYHGMVAVFEIDGYATALVLAAFAASVIAYAFVSKHRTGIRSMGPYGNMLRKEFESCERRAPPTNERGIVICAGGKTLMTCAFATVSMIRRVGCKLPVEIFYAGPDELGPGYVEAFSEFAGVRFVDAAAVVPYPCHEPKKLRGFAIKPYALLLTTFREALMLDADCAPLRDPTFLFDCPEFKKYGNIFWPDYWVSSQLVRPVVAKEFGMPQIPSGFETESGQVLVDTVRCGDALKWTWILNNHEDVFYATYYGDKDLYRIGFKLARTPFYQVKHSPGMIGQERGGRFVLDTMLQKTPRGNPLFAHRTMGKRLRDSLTWDLWNINKGEYGHRATAVLSKKEHFVPIPDLEKHTHPTSRAIRKIARCIQTDEDRFEHMTS